MIRFYFMLLLVSSSLACLAQVNIKIEVRSLPAKHPAGSALYLAGSFNGWNPGNENYRFKDSGNYFINLSLPPGKYEYKITRGNWDKVEVRSDGSAIDNRQLIVENDAITWVGIEGWQDQFPPRAKKNTASVNVFSIELGRKVWIYLPEGYRESRTKYPVLYIHDGQNLFSDSTGFSGEWGLDEFMDTTQLRKSIIVGIEHAGTKRLNEYNPFDHSRFGKGEAHVYMDYLVNTVRPYINKHYRTKKCRKHTGIAGSSMGGLVSMYGILKYPKVFGVAGVFSPAFWVAPGMYDLMKSRGEKVKSRIYFYAGKNEDENMVPDMLKAFQQMSEVSKARMITVIRDDGRHNEAAWRKEFPLFYGWINWK